MPKDDGLFASAYTDDRYSAAPPHQPEVPPLPDPLRYDGKRAAKWKEASGKRDMRRASIGAAAGLVIGVVVDVVLATTVVPAWFGSPWVHIGLLAGFILVGVLVGLIPSLRLEPENWN